MVLWLKGGLILMEHKSKVNHNLEMIWWWDVYSLKPWCTVVKSRLKMVRAAAKFRRLWHTFYIDRTRRQESVAGIATWFTVLFQAYFLHFSQQIASKANPVLKCSICKRLIKYCIQWCILSTQPIRKSLSIDLGDQPTLPLSSGRAVRPLRSEENVEYREAIRKGAKLRKISF